MADYADVGLDEAVEDGPDPSAPTGPIYPHGYSLRVRLLCDPEEAVGALRALGWSPTSKDWNASAGSSAERWTVRGSTFLTQRKPRNRRLPLATLNKAWRTCLYSVQIERRGETYYLDLHGVRRRDVERLLEGIMGLSSADPDPDYLVEYYRAAERYFVLSPHDALRLGSELGAAPVRGKGRIARKSFLARDVPVPLTIRRRSRRTALLNIYRIEGGATSAYKVEVRLAGKVRDRGHFSEADIARLDEALLDLVRRHQLAPLAKPARWEPVEPSGWRRDERLEKLGMPAYRGAKMPQEALQAVAACHPPKASLLGVCLDDPVACVARPYIRQSYSVLQNPRVPIHGYNTEIWKAIANDILTNQGHLSEVILDSSQDPAPPVLGLCEQAPMGSVALQAISYSGGSEPDTWGSILELLPQLPITPATETLMIVLDPSYLVPVSDAVSSWDEEDHVLRPGPLLRQDAYWDTMPHLVKAGAASLWDTLGELRSICEESGLRVVLMTVDARPDHGRGDLQRSHFFRDSRVRSHIGDAGRYWAHCRYLVDAGPSGRPQSAVLVKDEAEGLMGRIVYGPPTTDLF